MNNWKLSSAMAVGLFAATANVQALNWIAGINLGAALAKPGSTQTISTQATTSNTYTNTTSEQTNLLAGAFVGLNIPLSPLLNYQIGLAYDQIQAYSVNGQIQQLSDPQLTNFSDQYNVQSQQLFLESKLVFNMRHRLHPYVLVGVGSALNKASDFSVTAIDPTAVNPGLFSDHSTTNFAYELGLGVDVDVSKHVRLGAGYRYANLGKANLGAAPDFTSNEGLSTNLMAHELLLTATYLF